MDELEGKCSLRGQSWTKYLKRFLPVFIWTSALREKFFFNFSGVFAVIDKIFILGVTPGTSLQFYEFLKLSRNLRISEDPKSKSVWQIVRQIVYTMLITNNQASFQLYWKQNMVKDKKCSIHYEIDSF